MPVPFERVKVYGMLCGAILSIKTLRTAVNSAVPIMVMELQLSAAQSSTLLSAFYPGYLLTQMPAGPIVQRFGGKSTMSVCLFGTAACFLCVPIAMERGGVALTSALLGILGLLQGPMSPCQAQVNRDWIPSEGQERSNVLRIQGLAHTSAPMLAAIVTPLLAMGGWRRVFNVFGATVGVFSILWQILVSNRPKGVDEAPATSNPKPSPAVVGSPATGPIQSKTLGTKLAASASVEWRIFTLPSVVALMFWQFGSNFLFAVLQMLGPTFYMTTLNCSSERTGFLLALAQLANFPASFLGAATEAFLLKRMSKVAMSKTLTVAASVGEAVFALLYGLSKSAESATVWYAGVMLASQCQRAWSNFYEVGGKDVATLGSVANTVANGANLIIPFVSVSLRGMFHGSWVPLVGLAAVLKVAGGLWLAGAMSVVDGRQQVAEREAKREEAKKVT